MSWDVGSNIWSGNMDDDEEGRTSLLIFKGKYLEEYTVLNKKLGNGEK
jgi:hypothetical protein